MKTIFVLYLLGLGIALVYLWIINRDSDVILEKLFPAMAIGITGALFTLWFSLKEEKVETQFSSTLMYNKTSGEALERCDERYQLLYGGKLCQCSSFIKAPLKDSSDISFLTLYPDILFVETLTLLFTSQSQHPLGLIGCLILPADDPSFRDFPSQTLSWQDFSLKYKNKWRPEVKELFSKIEDPNIFSIFGIREMCLPKGTTIKIICDRSNRSISLKNDFCEINIKIYGDTSYSGLGEWKWILGYDDGKDKEFLSSKMKVYLSAKFYRIRSGHPDMPKYKRWVNLLFDRLRGCLDSEQQLKTAREKHHLYKEDIDSWFKSEELRLRNLPKTNATVTENQATNKQAAGDNQPVK